MNIIQAIILGIVQGLTEFIPVSSSGHLVLFHQWLGVTENGLAFDVALHAGTLAALILFFFSDIKKYAVALFKKNKDTKVAHYLILATIPAAVIGYVLESAAETTFRSTAIVAFNLFTVGLIMLVVENIYGTINKHSIEKMTLKQALIIGLAQSLAIVPGVSRSGGTIIAGMLTGFDRVAAARFSFLLGIPIIAGAVVKIFISDSGASALSDDAGLFIAGISAAFLSGLFAIRFMLNFLATKGLHAFAYYRMALGLIVFAVMIF
jgi:undecaprenyl-diphosphatase